jgi:hypothetical protein
MPWRPRDDACGVFVIETARVPDLPAVDRGLDMTARKPDIAQSTIVHFMKRFDRGPALQILGQAIGPESDPADKSARPAGSGRLCCVGRGNRGHRSSPLAPTGNAMPPAQPLLRSACASDDLGLLALSSVQSWA